MSDMREDGLCGMRPVINKHVNHTKWAEPKVPPWIGCVGRKLAGQRQGKEPAASSGGACANQGHPAGLGRLRTAPQGYREDQGLF